jgi:hypothetical protein
MGQVQSDLGGTAGPTPLGLPLGVPEQGPVTRGAESFDLIPLRNLLRALSRTHYQV